MRGNQTVLRCQEGIVTPNGFCGNHIQAGSIDFAGVESICKILLHNKLTAAVIDEDDTVFHFGNGLFVDHFIRLREERAMQHHNIRSC